MICSTCQNTKLILIGRLRDCHNFAGRSLGSPIIGGSLYQCSNCKLKFRYPALTHDQYKSLYDHNSQSNWDQLQMRNDWKLIADYIHTEYSNSARILDFGCDSGKLLSSLNSTFLKYGIELNSVARKMAEEATNSLIWDSLDAVPNDLQFNVIILSDVIEHVADPSTLISLLNKKLTADGVLIITTGDSANFLWRIFGANWWYCVYPEHISFISKDWITYICDNTRMTIVKFKIFKYLELHIFKYCINSIFMCFYGLLPRTYNALGLFIKRILNRPGDVPVKGVGVSKDHIFLVLKKSNLNEI